MQLIKLLLTKNVRWKYFRSCGTQAGQPAIGNMNTGQSEHNIRVRYTPSPTGQIHLNGLRVALFNYLFAKANIGKFIVRIDDIDHMVNANDAHQKQIFRHLEWAGIVPDESAVHGGNFGPYIQSQRLEIYQRSVRELLENGSAYYCFCTEKRLETIRQAAIGTKHPNYDNRCRDLAPLQVAENLANKVHPVRIRFKLDSDQFNGFNDIIHGHLNSDVSIDGDPIIIKSNGHPTYHFANVIDDHMMAITHVLRGAQWLPSTPKHLLLYSAFGWKPPEYAHLPLILNADGSTMNRFHEHANVEHYREQQIYPLALLNYVASCDDSQRRDNDTQPKIQKIPELIRSFDLRALSKKSSRFNAEHLNDYNRMELIRHIEDPELSINIVKSVQKLIQLTYPENIKYLDLGDQHIRNALNWSISTGHFQSIQQLVEGDLSFFWKIPKTNTNNVRSEWD